MDAKWNIWRCIFSLSFIFFFVHVDGQYYSSSQIDSIKTNKLGFEGDLYLDTINNTFFIGLANGILYSIGDTLDEKINRGYLASDSIVLIEGKDTAYVNITSLQSKTITDTRANILALQTSNQLKTYHTYVINDHVQGRLGAGTQIILQAVDSNRFAMHAQIKTTYDTQAWTGIYAIATGLITELQDNNGNIARGTIGTEVANFDWGNTRITNCLVDHSTWLLTYGANRVCTDVKITNSSSLNTTSQATGTLQNVSITNNSSVDLTNARVNLTNFTITNQSVLNYASFAPSSTSTQANWTIDNSTIDLSNSTSGVTLATVRMNGAILNHTGVSSGTITGSNLIMENLAQIDHINGAGTLSLNRSTLKNQANISHAQSSITLTNYTLDRSTLTKNIAGIAGNGNITLVDGYMNSGSYITHDGSGNISGTRFVSEGSTGYVLTELGSGGNITLTDCKLIQGYIRRYPTATTGNMSVTNSVIQTSAYIAKKGTGTLNLSLANMGSRSYIDQGGGYSITGTRFSSEGSVGYIIIDDGAIGTLNINDCKLIQGYIRIYPTAISGNTTVTNSMIQTSGYIQKRGTGNLTVTACNIISGGNVYYDGNKNLTCSNSAIFTGGRVRSISSALSGTDNVSSCQVVNGQILFNTTGIGNNSLTNGEIAGSYSIVTVDGTSENQTFTNFTLQNGRVNLTNQIANQSFSYVIVTGTSTVNFRNMATTRSISRIEAKNQSNITIDNPSGTGNIRYITAETGSTITINGLTGTAENITAKDDANITINGGNSIRITKQMTGTLTTGNFNHTNVIMISPTSRTLTTNNTNTSEYLGIISSSPLL